MNVSYNNDFMLLFTTHIEDKTWYLPILWSFIWTWTFDSYWGC